MMKQLFISGMLLFLFPSLCTAQEERDTSIGFKNFSLGIGAGMGQEFAINLFGTVNYKRGLYLGFQYLATSARSKEVPYGYVRKPGLFSNSTRTQRDHFEAYTFLLGQRFQKNNSRFSIHAETGLSIMTYSFARFRQNRDVAGQPVPGGTFTGYDTHHLAGWHVSERARYLLGTQTSLELSTYACINSARFILVENLSIAINFFDRRPKTIAVR